jgi:SPOR domain
MQKIIVPALAFLLGVTVALAVYESVLMQRSPGSREAGRSSTMGPAPSPGEPNALREPHAKAAQLLLSGHLREAQDVFLEILSLNPRDQAAFHGLAVVRRYMAGDNPATLRRQADAYWEAIRRGVEDEDHHSVRAMETLLTATLQAVQEIEARNPATQAVAGPPQAATPPAAVQPQNAVPANGKPPFPPAPAAGSGGPLTPALPGGKASTPAARPAKPPVPQTSAPSGAKALTPPKPAAPQNAIPSSAPPTRQQETPLSAPAPQAPPPPAEAPAGVRNRLYMVRVGPVSGRDLASAIARQLSSGGFPQANVTSRAGFRVVSDPLPRGVAEGLAASLADRGFYTQVEALGRDVVHVVFGSFASQQDAEALSQRIAAQGYDARVREEPVYMLQVGPYPQSSLDTISGIVKSSAPGAAVSVDPMP